MLSTDYHVESMLFLHSGPLRTGCRNARKKSERASLPRTGQPNALPAGLGKERTIAVKKFRSGA